MSPEPASGNPDPSKLDKLLLDAFGRKDEAGLKRALEAGADPNATQEGVPLLTIAAVGQWEAAFRLLLAARADANARDREGRTPIMYLAWLGHSEFHGTAFDELISRGADVNAADSGGACAVDMAAIFLNERMASRLLALRARGRPASRRKLESLAGPTGPER